MRWWSAVGVFTWGFCVGCISLAAFEAFILYFFFLKRLNRQELNANSLPHHLDPHQSLDFAFNKKGFVWVLESDKVPKSDNKASKDVKKKKEIFEVHPVKKCATIKDRFLILSDSDGSHASTRIPLRDCVIEAVSATDLPSRKWAKRFPIKLESKTSVIYNGSRTLYIYLDTSWEKEAWCKALRLASCNDKQKLTWFTKLDLEFHSYLSSLNTGYPSFMKPSAGFNSEPTDRVAKMDGSGSKVRLFLKKLAGKASRTSVENRATLSLGRDERKVNNDKAHSFQDPILTTNLIKTAPTAKPPLSEEESSVSSFTFSRSSSHSPNSDVDYDDKLNIDEGTLCFNLLISRIFFDARNNASIKNSVQERIQRTLSSMRRPNYIGEIICTGLRLGSLPPYIHGIRVLPTDMNEVWSWEIDVEYCGGLVLDIETRLEVQHLEKDMVDPDSDTGSVVDVSSELLEGFEHLGKQLNVNIPEETADVQEPRTEGNAKIDRLKISTSQQPTSSNVSRWKSILNSVAKQVSQVPLSLSIRVASLRGTMRLHIKPPPSDQLWYGFTHMPDIDFDLESSVGDHKLSSTHIALFLINRFKAAIKETIVLPNCESICIPCMMAEKNDWIPRAAAPFMWLSRGPNSSNSTPSETHDEEKTEDANRRVSTSSNDPEIKNLKAKNPECIQESISAASDPSASSTKPSIQSSKSLEELKSPLLASYEQEETSQRSREYISEGQSPSRSLIHVEKQNHDIDEDDSRPKRMGRRARMLDLGKKMGEKLEEKRRHIEEKGRNIVEKMRGP